MIEQSIRDGLMLRSLSDDYRQALGGFVVEVFGHENPEEDLIGWIDDLTNGRHPTVTDDDVWIITDPAQENRIVSCLFLIPQTWRYEDIRLPVGRIEIVATHEDYRRRGLARILMETAHQRCEKLGINVLAITGIPGYYRQFGYTMAVDLGSRSFISLENVSEPEERRYSLHRATVDDIPQLMAWWNIYAVQTLLSVERDRQQWEYSFTRRVRTEGKYNYFLIRRKTDGKDVGYISLNDLLYGRRMVCLEYVVGEEASYLDTFDDVLYEIKLQGEARQPSLVPTLLSFDNGVHPSIELMIERMLTGYNRPHIYSWYMRVASPAKLILDIAPVLERRLNGSAAHRYSGELAFDFYDKTGLVMVFEDGKLINAEDLWQEDTQVGFAYHTFLHLVFGYHTLLEIRAIQPDTLADKTATTLLDALFPKKQSWVVALS